MDPTYILNLANNITRQSMHIATMAELSSLPNEDDMRARCETIKQLADDILAVYQKDGEW